MFKKNTGELEEQLRKVHPSDIREYQKANQEEMVIDKEGFSQSECAAYMKVARTTVQEIYAAARHKTASALVEGRPLHIEGGNYRICEGHGTLFACRNCYQRRQASETGGNDNV